MLCFCITGMAVYAQQVKLVDADNGRAVPDVWIFNTATNTSYFTDSKGFANVRKESASDTFIIKLMGYETLKLSYAEVEQQNYIITLKAGAILTEEVVIAANKWEQRRRDMSSHSITVTKLQTERLNPQTTADLLAQSGAVFVQKSQAGGGSPMIRGFATNRVLLVIDGVRMNTSIFRAGNLQNVIRLDANNTEAAEVVFGPGSLIYGSDALGGVMDFHSLTPKLSNTDKWQVSGHAMGRFSSANAEKSGHANIQIAHRKFSSITSFTFSDFDDVRMGSNNGPDDYLRNTYQNTIIKYDSLGRKTVLDTFYKNPNPQVQKGSGFSQWNVMQKLRYQVNAYNNLIASFHISRSGNVPRYDRLTEIANGVPRFAEWYYGPEQWMMGHLKYHNTKSNRIFSEMKVNLAYQQNKESRNDRRYNNRWLRRQNETVHGISLNADFNKEISPVVSVFYGVEGVLNRNLSVADRLDVRMDTTQHFAPRYPNGWWQSYAGYLSTRVKLANNKLILNAGIRYNHILINTNFDTTLFRLPFNEANLNFGAVTGSAGISYLPTDSWRLYTNFTSGFRAPNIDDIGKIFESAPGVLVVPNKNLKAEYALNGEAGVEKRIGKVATLYVGGYYTYLLNALTLAPFSLNGSDSLFFDGENNALRAIQNSSFSYIWGIQTQVKFNFGHGFGAWGTFNYQFGRERFVNETVVEMTAIRHVAPLFGTFHITYTHKWAHLDFYTDYCGSFKGDNFASRTLENPALFPIDNAGNRYSPAWYTLNIKSSFDISKYLTLQAGIENITDIRYRTYSSGINAPGINFSTTLRLRF